MGWPAMSVTASSPWPAQGSPSAVQLRWFPPAQEMSNHEWNSGFPLTSPRTLPGGLRGLALGREVTCAPCFGSVVAAVLGP